MDFTRRTFLGSSAAAVLAAGTMTKGQVFGANEKVGMCVMGINGRGGSHISNWLESPDSELVAVCDVDEKVLRRVAKGIKDKTGKDVKTYVDIRDALQDPDVDAISIATPNHWHTLATLWACEAGKDVYVEKPAAHNIFEAQQVKAAAAKYDRIIQHGTQSRSNLDWLRDMPLLQSGEIIGPVYMARCLGYKNGNRGSLGSPANEAPPETLQWDLWQGPASRQEFNPAYHPYSWHWFWHYGNGEIGNQGVHQMDVGVWGMNKGLPVKVYSAGGRYTYEDLGETPNTNIATFTYEDGTVMVFEVRNRFTNTEGGMEVNGKMFPGVGVGNLFYADHGYYVEGAGFFDEKNKHIPLDPAKYPTPEKSDNHFQHFLDAVKSRDKGLIPANMDAAHLACVHIAMANTSYRLGQSLEFDAKAEQYTGHGAEEANKHLTREYAEGFEVQKIA